MSGLTSTRAQRNNSLVGHAALMQPADVAITFGAPPARPGLCNRAGAGQGRSAPSCRHAREPRGCVAASPQVTAGGSGRGTSLSAQAMDDRPEAPSVRQRFPAVLLAKLVTLDAEGCTQI
jgi:hypothetical protein